MKSGIPVHAGLTGTVFKIEGGKKCQVMVGGGKWRFEEEIWVCCDTGKRALAV